MARAVLEDLGGSIPVVFFPKTYDRHAEALRTETPVLIRGRLSADDDRYELHGEEIIPLEQSWSRCTQRLVLELDPEVARPEKLAELRALLDLQPGEVPVSIRLRLPDASQALLELPGHKVAVSPGLVEKVDVLFGREVARCAVG